MGDYIPTRIEQEHQRWCMANNIKISPTAKTNVEWWIDIVIEGRVNRSPETYSDKTIWIAMYKFYKYYYDKFSKE